MPFHHLALKGGGARGYIYIGVFQELFKLGLLEDITAISGSSVGAISALFASAGFSIEKLKEKILNIDFEKLIFDQYTISEPINWMEYFGLHQGKALYELFKSLVKTATGDENTTFKQWHEYSLLNPDHHLKNIYVEACNISLMGGYNQIFSYDSPLCDTPVALAVSASMAFPQFFSPKLINDCYYSDGGMQANCPVGVFEKPKGTPNPHTLGIWLDDHHNIELFKKGILPPKRPINHFYQCISAQIDALLNVQNFELLESQYKKQMIYCDTIGIGTLDFNLTLDQKEALIASGEYGVIRFVTEHFPELAKQHYPAHLLETIEKLEHPISLQVLLKNLHDNPELSLNSSFASFNLENSVDYIEKWSNLTFIKPHWDPNHSQSLDQTTLLPSLPKTYMPMSQKTIPSNTNQAEKKAPQETEKAEYRTCVLF